MKRRKVAENIESVEQTPADAQDINLTDVEASAIEEAAGRTIGDLGNTQPEPDLDIIASDGSTIEQILSECAEGAESFYAEIENAVKHNKKLPSAHQANAFNPIFVGPTGAGKTSIIETWARDHGYELVSINMLGDPLDFSGIKTITDVDVQIDDEGNTAKEKRVSTISTKAFDVFRSGKKKILFLDEINKTNPMILKSLFDLISFHIIQNGDDRIYLPKLIFTVGAMNPSVYGSDREPLDPALRARMFVVEVSYETKPWLKYEQSNIKALIEAAEEAVQDAIANKDKEEFEKWSKVYQRRKGQFDLITALVTSREFKWSDEVDIQRGDDTSRFLIPRTLESAILACDGTKISFLRMLKRYCGDEAEAMAEAALAGAHYEDKDHISKAVWGKSFDPDSEEVVKNREKALGDDAEAEVLASAEGQAATGLSSMSASQRLRDTLSRMAR